MSLKLHLLADSSSKDSYRSFLLGELEAQRKELELLRHITSTYRQVLKGAQESVQITKARREELEALSPRADDAIFSDPAHT
jgi:hypothetical protein